MYFKLNNIDYEVLNCSVRLYNEEAGMRMYIEVNAKTQNQEIDFELSEVSLYQNNGFCTDVHDVKLLENRKFVWENPINDRDEEAGYFCVLEHEDVTKGTIEILKVDNNSITIHWSGLANVFWNSEFGANVPFDTEFTANLDGQVR